MTQEQLTAIGEIISELERANKGRMGQHVVENMLRNPNQQPFHYWFAKTIKNAAISGDDLIGARLSQLRELAGVINPPSIVEQGVISLAYSKDKADKLRADVRRTFGRSVQIRREAMGLSQAELAERTGLLQSHISRIESGRYNVTLDTIAMLSSVLGDLLSIIS